MDHTLFSSLFVILFQLCHDLSLAFFHILSIFAVLVLIKELAKICSAIAMESSLLTYRLTFQNESPHPKSCRRRLP